MAKSSSGTMTAPQDKDEPSSDYLKQCSSAFGASPAIHGSIERGATSQRQTNHE